MAPVRPDELSVLDVGAAVPPQKMLYAYLVAEAQKHFDARRAAVAELKTAEDVQRRQHELRAKFIEAIGGFPEKTPLNARVVGAAKRDGCRIEKVIYESRPGHHVTAVLYLPEGEPPFPGVLVPCGHSANGKAAEAYQRAAILLAKNGLAALCYDPIGQGERCQLVDDAGKPVVAGSTTEHTLAGVGALLVGRSTAGYRIWDGIRSLDYLASRPDIDPARLGCTGNSGGGTLTAYLMALDDRIVAAAPSCYITSLERLFATIGPQDAEQNITGQVAFGMEHADYVTMRAPRPTLICIGTQDYFDQQGAWTSFREAKLTYGMLGHGERVDLFEYNDKHGFSRPRREAAMRWMRRWLLGRDDAPVETDFPIFTDEELQCTRTGQVLADFRGEARSVFDLNAERAADLEARRGERTEPRDRTELLRTVRRLIALPADIPAARRETLGVVKREGYSIQKLVFETEPGLKVPALFFGAHELSSPQGPVVMYLHGEGKGAESGPGGAIESLSRTGFPVLAIDLRGMGETAPGKASWDRPGQFGSDVKEAFLSLHIARPLVGQRVWDVRAVLSAIEKDAPLGVHLIGVGAAGPIALHAAALDSRVRSLQLEGSLATWTSAVQTPLARNQLANVAPGVLAHYDLPDLMESLVPRPLTVVAPADAVGGPATGRLIEAAVAGCRAAYARAGAADQFTLRADTELRFIDPDPATGSSRAVMVGDVPLVHTAQVLATNSTGQVVGKGRAAEQIEQVLRNLATDLAASGSGIDHVAKLNVVASGPEVVAEVKRAMAARFNGPAKPAVSFVTGRLAHPDAMVAMDAVATHRDAPVLPASGTVYVAGQAEKGDLPEATRHTLESLRRTLEHMGLGDEHVVQLKCFMRPMSNVADVEREMRRHFGDRAVPPLVFVEWDSTLPIEIELVAHSPRASDDVAPAIEYITPPGMTASPVFCRVVRVNRGPRIFVSGLYSAGPGDGQSQVTDVFEQLGAILRKANSDYRHLAKATYYVSDNDASTKLNELRPRYYDPKRPPSASKAVVAGTGVAGRTLTLDMIAVPASAATRPAPR
jgi:enamine deaminase RidA (YjgF/YER057c/UK114 family)/dienelactone hydrolase